MSSNIKVYCRIKPYQTIFPTETQTNAFPPPSCIQIMSQNQIMFINQNLSSNPHKKNSLFSFDCVFSDASSQSEVFDITAKPILEKLFEGFNATILAYGQTNSGKTYSLLGEKLYQDQSDLYAGITPRAVDYIFNGIKQRSDNDDFKITVSFFEIYNEKIKDLITHNQSQIKIRERNEELYLENITEKVVQTPDQVINLLSRSLNNRSIYSTKMNENSSRSHYIFQLVMERTNKTDFKTYKSKLIIVDLAGSEKLDRTNVEGKSLEEAKNINKSLSELGNVIAALSENSTRKDNVDKHDRLSQTGYLETSFRTELSDHNSKRYERSNSKSSAYNNNSSHKYDRYSLTDEQQHQEHKPKFISFRNSKLTRLLQNSLGGNSYTALMVTVSSDFINDQETLSTLRFGSRAKLIKNSPVMQSLLTQEQMLKLIQEKDKHIIELSKRLAFFEKNSLTSNNNEFTSPRHIAMPVFAAERKFSHSCNQINYQKDQDCIVAQSPRQFSQLLEVSSRTPRRLTHIESNIPPIKLSSDISQNEFLNIQKTFENINTSLGKTLEDKSQNKNDNLLNSAYKKSEGLTNDSHSLNRQLVAKDRQISDLRRELRNEKAKYQRLIKLLGIKFEDNFLELKLISLMLEKPFKKLQILKERINKLGESCQNIKSYSQDTHFGMHTPESRLYGNPVFHTKNTIRSSDHKNSDQYKFDSMNETSFPVQSPIPYGFVNNLPYNKCQPIVSNRPMQQIMPFDTFYYQSLSMNTLNVNNPTLKSSISTQTNKNSHYIESFFYNSFNGGFNTGSLIKLSESQESAQRLMIEKTNSIRKSLLNLHSIKDDLVVYTKTIFSFIKTFDEKLKSLKIYKINKDNLIQIMQKDLQSYKEDLENQRKEIDYLREENQKIQGININLIEQNTKNVEYIADLQTKETNRILKPVHDKAVQYIDENLSRCLCSKNSILRFREFVKQMFELLAVLSGQISAHDQAYKQHTSDLIRKNDLLTQVINTHLTSEEILMTSYCIELEELQKALTAKQPVENHNSTLVSIVDLINQYSQTILSNEKPEIGSH